MKQKQVRSYGANWPELREFMSKCNFFETYIEEILSEKELSKLNELKNKKKNKY